MGCREENINYREALYKEQTQKQCSCVEDADGCAHDHGFGQEEL